MPHYQKFSKLHSLSVFFPCFNEEKSIPFFVKEAAEVLPKLARKFEVIIVNDGSRDRTLTVAKRMAKQFPFVRVVSHPFNRGYGASLRTGFQEARYDWVFFTDGDLQFSLSQLREFIPFAQNHRAIIGYRKKRAEGFKRVRNAYLYKRFVDALFRLHVIDIDCAFKLFRTELIHSLKLESSGAFISAELLYKLKKKRVKFKQLPVDHFPRKYGSPTGANLKVILKACWESLRLYLHMKFPWIQLQNKKTSPVLSVRSVPLLQKGEK